MKKYIEKRVMDVANFVLESKSTIRKTASIFGYSKSTIYRDLTEKLPVLNYSLYLEVKEVIKFNKEQRNIRGGMANKLKNYSNINK